MWRSERRGRTLLSWQAVTDRSKDEEEGAAGLRWLCVTGVGQARWLYERAHVGEVERVEE